MTIKCTTCGAEAEQYTPNHLDSCADELARKAAYEKSKAKYEEEHQQNLADAKKNVERQQEAAANEDDIKKMLDLVGLTYSTEEQRDARARFLGAPNARGQETLMADRNWIHGCTLPARGSAFSIECAAMLAGATFCELREAANAKSEYVAFVQSSRATFANVEALIQRERPAGIKIHVVQVMPDIFAYARPRAPRSMLERFRAWFGARFTEVVRLELK